jgi:hypothetical protein
VVGNVVEGGIEKLVVGGDGTTVPVISNAPFGALPQPVRQASLAELAYQA